MPDSILLKQTNFLWRILGWVYPANCCECDLPGQHICAECLKKMRTPGDKICQVCGKPLDPLDGCATCSGIKVSFDEARAAFLYEGTIRKAIHQLKFDGNLGIAELFSNFLFSLYLRLNWNPDLIVPVPLTKRKMNERGFNQSEWIAKPLSKATGIRFLKGALQKTADTETQVGLSRQERSMNLKGAFRAEPAMISGKNILLIDDVMTTGATFNECACELKESGADQVFCLSVATTDLL